MMEDDSFPPEIQKTPAEFGFRELCNLRTVNSGEQPTYDAVRSSLLVVSNKFGNIYVGTPKGVKVFSSAAILDAGKKNLKEVGSPVAEISLRHSPNWLDLSSDNLTFSVCCCTDKGPQVLFFDARTILNKAKPTKTPFQSLFLSKVPDAYVTSLKWNPSQEFTYLLAICLSTGSFHLLSVEKSVQEVAMRPDSFGASAVSWSPKGKQMMVGKKDGSLHQLTQKLENRKIVTVTNVIDRSVKTCDLLWLSTHCVGAAYVASDDSSFNQPNLFLANMPSKDEKRDVIWKNYEDPCFGMNESKESQYFFAAIDQWRVFVLLSSNSTDIAVIGKNPDSEIWEIWTLDDSSRAALPISEFTEDDSVPIGADIITTTKDRIVIGDAKDCGPMPVLAVLNNDGVLCLYHMINLMNSYADIVRPEETLDLSNERTAVHVKNQTIGSGDGGKAPLSSTKQKLSAKPSLTFSSSPKSMFFSDEKSKPSPVPSYSSKPAFAASTPVVRKLPPFTEGPSMIHQLMQSKVQPNSPITTDLLVKSPPDAKVKPLAEHEAADITLDADKSLLVEALRPKQLSSGLHKKLDTTSQSTQQTFSNDFLLLGDKSSKSSEKVPTASSNGGQTRSVQVSTLTRSKVITPFTKPSVDASLPKNLSGDQGSASTPNKGDTVDPRMTLEDIKNFQSELDLFRSSVSKVDHTLKLFENDGGKKDLTKKLDNLDSFSDEISKTTEELNSEIQDAKTGLLALISNTEDFNRKQNQTHTGMYKALLYSRPLEQSKLGKLEAIRAIYHYVVNSVRDTNAALDAKWESTSGKRWKARNKRELWGDWENAYIGLVNNMKILHQQEAKVMLLSQQLDRLRLEKTSVKKPVNIPLKSSKVTTSRDLRVLADQLLLQRTGDDPKPALALGSLEVGPGTRRSLSPKKQVQLGQMLAKRKVAPVRTSSKTSTSIMVNNARNIKQENASTSSGLDNASSPPESLLESSSGSSSSSEDTLQDDLLQQEFVERTESRQPLPSASVSHKPDVKFPIREDQPFEPKYSMIPQGSATLAYGAPKSATVATRRREIPLLSTTSVEATSNLNNPPQVVNIQKFDIPLSDETLLPEKFEPKPEVPMGAAEVVQNVFNLVKAEKQSQQTKDFSHIQDRIKTIPQPFNTPPILSVKSLEQVPLGSPVSTDVEASEKALLTHTQKPVLSLPPNSSVFALDRHLPIPQKSAIKSQAIGLPPSIKDVEKSRKGVEKSASMPLVTSAPLSTIATSQVSSPPITTSSNPAVFSLSSGIASGSLPELFKLGSGTTLSTGQTNGNLTSGKSANLSSLSTSSSSIQEGFTVAPPLAPATFEGTGSPQSFKEAITEDSAGPKSSVPECPSVKTTSSSLGIPAVGPPYGEESHSGHPPKTACVEASGIQVNTTESEASKVSAIFDSTEASVDTTTSAISNSQTSITAASCSTTNVAGISGKLFQASSAFTTNAESSKDFTTTNVMSATVASSAGSESSFSSNAVFGEKKTIGFGLGTAPSSSPFQATSVFGKAGPSEPETLFESTSKSSTFKGNSLFAHAKTESSGSLFESTSAPIQTDQVFGGASANKPVFGTLSAFGAGASGAPQTLFGSIPAQPKPESAGFGSFMTPAKESPSVFGGFGFSGLGGKPSDDAAKKNPFQASASSTDEQNSSTLFGAAGAKSFGQATSGFGQGFGGSVFSSSGGGVGSQGFGGFNKPQQSVFGAAPAFGSPPSFGSSSRTFGSGFGVQPLSTSTFGQTSGGESGGFASFAKNDAPGFGNIAGFGASQPPAFGSSSFGQQNQKASFSGWR